MSRAEVILRGVFIFFHCLLIASFPLRAWTAEPILIINTPESRPYAYEEAGELKGLFLELVQEAFRRAHTPIEIHFLPWARCMEEVRFGRSDAMFVVYKTPEREEYFDFTEEYLTNLHERLYVRRDEDFDITDDLATLRGHQVGILNFTKHGDRIAQAIEQAKFGDLVSVNSYDSLSRMLASGRLDATLGVSDAMIDSIKSLHLEELIREVGGDIDVIPAYLVFSKRRDSRLTRDAFDRALRSMRQDGTYERIIARYPPKSLPGGNPGH